MSGIDNHSLPARETAARIAARIEQLRRAGWKYRDIAERVGRSEAVCRMLARRARLRATRGEKAEKGLVTH